MVCLDNSEWMRNGDYPPSTRLDAQQDAVTLLCLQRTNDHPESTVGTLSMAGETTPGVELLVSPTIDQEKILASFARLTSGGKSDFMTSLQIAQLAIKHRVNTSGGKRIIIFIGSPIQEDNKVLVKAGKALRKDQVAVDVVLMGELEANQAKMEEFINAVNNADNSHLLSIPSGVYPTDALRTSPLMSGGGGGHGIGGSNDFGGGTAGGPSSMFAEFGGIDPNLDPDMAMVMRESIQMEEARAKAEAAAGGGGGGGGDGSSSSVPAPAPAAAAAGDMTDDEALALASRLSLESPLDTAANNRTSYDDFGVPDEDDEDEALRLAIAMSMQDEENASAAPPTAPAPGGGGWGGRR